MLGPWRSRRIRSEACYSPNRSQPVFSRFALSADGDVCVPGNRLSRSKRESRPANGLFGKSRFEPKRHCYSRRGRELLQARRSPLSC